MSDLRDMFFEECDDLLEGLSIGLTALECGDGDGETINSMFRSVHSIKGGAGAFKLDQLVSFSHAFENVLDDVRSGKTRADEGVVALLFTASDHLADLVEAAREGVELEVEKGASILSDLKLLSGVSDDDEGGAMSAEELAVAADFQPLTLDLGGPEPGIDLGDAPGLPDLAGAGKAFQITFRAHRELYDTGNEPAILFRALAELGTLEVSVDDSAVGPLLEQDWSEPVLTWTLTLTAAEPLEEDRIRDVFEFVEGVCDLAISRDAKAAEAEAQLPAIADLPPVLPAPNEALTFGTRRDKPDMPVPEPAAGQPVAATADDPCADVAGPVARSDTGNMPPARADEAKSGGTSSSRSTIRVELQRVDRLINLVGELVISEAMLSQSMSELPVSTTSTIDNAMSQLKQLSGILQESVMAIRAQPVRGLFQRMSRIVRESARQAGKSAKLVTIGDATEVDKTVTERLVEPLTHMIRNAVDHGLEDADMRSEAGKSERGTVTLSAAHRSGRVVITLSDDGGGIDRARVRAKAEEKGLITPGEELSDADIDNLLFLPGFSTAGEVSNLSGRGVGMDVVRSEIQALGGRVSLASTPGEGTTVTISLPLTLAVLEGMIVQTADQTVVVPTTALRETFLASEAAVHEFMNGDCVLQMRDGLVPIVDLGQVLGYRHEAGVLDGQSLLLIEGESGHRTALAVDRVFDQREVVIKGLEQNYRQVSGIAAATILGDGKIALIVDTDQLVAPPVSAAHTAALYDQTAGVASHV